jgi:hypothetical protein
MDPVVFLEMLVPLYQITWHSILENVIFFFKIGSCLNKLVSITEFLFVLRYKLIMMCTNSSIFFITL